MHLTINIKCWRREKPVDQPLHNKLEFKITTQEPNPASKASLTHCVCVCVCVCVCEKQEGRDVL
jgi:hypothetical protein